VIDTAKRYEEEMVYERRPIGMTMQFPVPSRRRVDDPLFEAGAVGLPGYDEEIFAGGGHPMARGSPHAAAPASDSCHRSVSGRSGL
jgi:hypothetical protein